jgi:hypothetical protein
MVAETTVGLTYSILLCRMTLDLIQVRLSNL